jgi:hypothetical protein
MALQRDYTIPNTNYTVANAYHIITEVEVNKKNTDDAGPSQIEDHINVAAKENSDPVYWKKGYTSKLKVEVYANKQARLDGKKSIGILGVQSSDIDSQLGTKGMDHKIVFYLDTNTDSSVFEQAYTYLKSTAYYSNAQDV